MAYNKDRLEEKASALKTHLEELFPDCKISMEARQNPYEYSTRLILFIDIPQAALALLD